MENSSQREPLLGSASGSHLEGLGRLPRGPPMTLTFSSHQLSGDSVPPSLSWTFVETQNDI